MADESTTARVLLVGVPLPPELQIAEKLTALFGGPPDYLRDDGGPTTAWLPALGDDGEPRIFYGSEEEVVEEYAGTGEDARPGTYRAVFLGSWRGATEIVLPEKPKPETGRID